MATGICLTCARTRQTDRHHVAGRRNHPEFVVPLCVPCHKLVTQWQRALGVDLAEGPRDSVDRLNAVLVGVALLVEIALARHPLMVPEETPHDLRLVSRALKRGHEKRQRLNGRPPTSPDARVRTHRRISPSAADPEQNFAQWLEVLATVLVLIADEALRRLDVPMGGRS